MDAGTLGRIPSKLSDQRKHNLVASCHVHTYNNINQRSTCPALEQSCSRHSYAQQAGRELMKERQSLPARSLLIWETPLYIGVSNGTRWPHGNARCAATSRARRCVPHLPGTRPRRTAFLPMRSHVVPPAMFIAVGRARELRQRYGCRDRARHRQQTGAHLLLAGNPTFLSPCDASCCRRPSARQSYSATQSA
eukprot:COSAG01_NODE_12251_length_1773_cov_1.735962_2_plen_193_part_00